MAAYSPSLVANAFLYRAMESRAPLSHMQLQKLVYFVHAWSLAIHGASMLTERPQAWTYGPVFDSLYHELKGYQSRNVDAYLEQMNPGTGQRSTMVPAFNDAAFWNLLDQVWQRYGKFSAMQLSAMTHELGGPWDRARQSNAGWLDDHLIAEHYRAQLHAAS